MPDDRFEDRLWSLARQISRSISEFDLVDRVVSGHATPGGGPHPLDLPSDEQGRALSALGSGRWTVRPGSGRLASTSLRRGLVEPPENPDLTGELRARDWITADGTVTSIGRQALLRWCRTVEPEGRVAAENEADNIQR